VAHAPLLLLIGLRCSGKTTLGTATAKAIGASFEDLDARALALLDCTSVIEAFERHHESGWRHAEAQALREALKTPAGGVLAVGGGTPTAPTACESIRAAQSEGWLRVALLHPGNTTLAQRLSKHRGDRPRLAAEDSAEVTRLAHERLPLYRSLADITVDTRQPAGHCVARLSALLTDGRWRFPATQASESPRVRSRRAS
jgi:shikimate kinase